MMLYSSTLVLVTCVSCLGLAPSSGKNTNLYKPTLATSAVGLSTPSQVAQVISPDATEASTPSATASSFPINGTTSLPSATASSSPDAIKINIPLAAASSSPSPKESSSPTATEPPVLKLGAGGSQVTDLQIKLKQLGYYNGVADGVYGSSTQVAVAKFQKSIGLEADGVAGSTTWNRLQKAALAQQESLADKPKPTQSPKSSPGVNKLWLLVGFVVTVGGVGLGLLLLLKWFGKSTNVEPEPEAESTPPFPDPSFSESSNGTASGNGSQKDTLPLDTNKNGYADRGLEQAFLPEQEATENEESPLSPFTQPLLSGSFLGQSSLSESTEGTPREEMALEKTTPLPRINIVDELIQELQSSNPAKRRHAIWNLAQRGDSRAVQPLLELMIDSDSQQRSLILDALSQIGTRILKPMNRALAISLQDESPQVRKNAIRDLTLIYDMISQINHLLLHATDDPDPEVQQTARWALEQLNRMRTNSGIESLPGWSNSSGFPHHPPEEPPQ